MRQITSNSMIALKIFEVSTTILKMKMFENEKNVISEAHKCTQFIYFFIMS